MSVPGVILREIHRLRRNIKDLSEKINQGPQRIKAQHAAMARQEDALKKAQDELKHLKVKTHEKEVSLKATDEQIKKYDRQLNDIISKKEFDAIKLELETCRNAKSKLEDEILAALMNIEERQGRLPELEKALSQCKATAAQLEQEFEARRTELTRQREEVQNKLAEIEASLPADSKPLYDRLVALKGEDALSTVANRTCLACYTEVTSQNFNDLTTGKFLLCKNCGRMLYLQEEPAKSA